MLGYFAFNYITVYLSICYNLRIILYIKDPYFLYLVALLIILSEMQLLRLIPIPLINYRDMLIVDLPGEGKFPFQGLGKNYIKEAKKQC